MVIIFGLLLTLSGSILLAIMVVIRSKKDINHNLIQISLPVSGQVSPKILNILIETYFYRTGLFYIALGSVLQIFPEFDLKISSLSISVRVSIVLNGFLIVGLSNYVIKKLAKHKSKKFLPFDPDNAPQDGDLAFDVTDK